MELWQEELVKLRTINEIAKQQAKTDAEVVDHLIPAFYFSQEAAKKLRCALDQINDGPGRTAVQDGLAGVLRTMRALVETAKVSGLGTQIALADAFKLVRADLESLARN